MSFTQFVICYELATFFSGFPGVFVVKFEKSFPTIKQKQSTSTAGKVLPKVEIKIC